MSDTPDTTNVPDAHGASHSPRRAWWRFWSRNAGGESQPTEPRRPRADRTAVMDLSGRIVGIAMLATIVAIAVVGREKLSQRASELKSVTPAVQFSWPPLAGLTSSEPTYPGGPVRTWVNAEIRAHLEKIVLDRVSEDPLDHAGLTAARSALLDTGWFKEDLSLVRDPAGRGEGLVRVLGTWRVPLAAVRYQGKDRLVAEGGELLPPTYDPDSSGFKVIIGTRHEPDRFGKPWPGGDVQAALLVLKRIDPLPCSKQVAAVDVSEFAAWKNLVLVSQFGNRILWGGPADEFNPGQASTDVKLSRLQQLYREQGRIDAGRPLLDIRLIDGVYAHDTENTLGQPAAPVENGKGGKNAKPGAKNPTPTKPAPRSVTR